MHPMIKDMTVNFSNRYTSGDFTQAQQSVTVLSSKEMTLLQGTGESLHIAVGGDSFGALLAPMAAEGARDSFLVPVFFNNSLCGFLTLGYRQIAEHIREHLLRARQITGQIAVALENVRLIEELNHLNLGTIKALANAVDAKSPWTAGHSLRVTNVALNIGREMGLSELELELLHKGGLFHDIGKIGVPESILDKAGKLTDDEFATIRKHPEIGAEIMRPIQAYHKLIPIVLQHHEWFNGKGYPHGRAGEAISPLARILAVADVYDALISDRPYRQGWEYSRVISYLEENSGSQFDPVVVQVVLKIDNRSNLESSAIQYQDDV
jgi:putative nucleotidyltransferase with HDIG domain